MQLRQTDLDLYSYRTGTDMICYRYFLIGLVMVKILHEDIGI